MMIRLADYCRKASAHQKQSLGFQDGKENRGERYPGDVDYMSGYKRGLEFWKDSHYETQGEDFQIEHIPIRNGRAICRGCEIVGDFPIDDLRNDTNFLFY